MNVAMINDCAFVGETLLKYLPSYVERVHVKRTRSLWDKTFSLAFKIMKIKADVYHVHYLLQDCYLAVKLGKKPLVGHAHGSDLREQIHSRKWGWIVRHNLKKCDKILVAQPTILDTAKEFNDDTLYFPIPFDPELFHPKPLPDERERKIVLIASSHNFSVKGTDKFLKALKPFASQITVKGISLGNDCEKAKVLAKNLGLDFKFIKPVSHEKMNDLYWESDLVLGSFGVGQLDTVAIEAMACGRPVVHSIRKAFFPDCPLEELHSIKEAADVISRLLFDRKEREKRVAMQLQYVNSEHSAPTLAEKLMDIYEEMISYDH
ncbi:glycosyltransferase family 4 protein [Candidatus Bathyarchaeota archaeon]|nr:glycosyltransferase family 4 protein [Candidatus Bathyarchaeota archaeon]